MATIDLTLSDDDAPPAAPVVVHDLTLDSDSDVEQAPANAGEAPQPAPAPRVLGVCSSSTCSKDATLRCGVCKVAKYCSVACQRRDWKLHKAVCAPIRSEKAGKHLRTSAE